MFSITLDNIDISEHQLSQTTLKKIRVGDNILIQTEIGENDSRLLLLRGSKPKRG